MPAAFADALMHGFARSADPARTSANPVATLSSLTRINPRKMARPTRFFDRGQCNRPARSEYFQGFGPQCA
jgi:hypothetical protein